MTGLRSVLLAGLVMSVVGAGATPEYFMLAAARIVLALVIAVLVSFALLRFMPRTRFGRQLILDTGLDKEPDSDLRWLGKRGRTLSPLRPAGIVDIDGTRVDVVSEGDRVEADTPVDVVRVDGNRIVRGTIDCLVRSGDRVTVLEFKTGRSRAAHAETQTTPPRSGRRPVAATVSRPRCHLPTKPTPSMPTGLSRK